MNAAPHSTDGTGHITRPGDFWLVYPATNQDATFADALHALYYLPQNYKLIVLTSGHITDVMRPAGHDSLVDRIQFKKKTELDKASAPFSFGHAVISDTHPQDTGPHSVKPIVVVSDKADTDLAPNLHRGFTVAAGNPPALASAILHIARGHGLEVQAVPLSI